MKRIIIHWTAGGHYPNATDKEHYHYLIDKDGDIIPAVPVRRNEPPLSQGYAAHTYHCNTDSIGISICACMGAKEKPLNFGPYPPTKAQLTTLIYLCTKMCNRYKIPVDDKHVLTHGEVYAKLGIPQQGKWDLNFLPGIKGAGGNYLRKEIKKMVKERPDIK